MGETRMQVCGGIAVELICSFFLPEKERIWQSGALLRPLTPLPLPSPAQCVPAAAAALLPPRYPYEGRRPHTKSCFH